MHKPARAYNNFISENFPLEQKVVFFPPLIHRPAGQKPDGGKCHKSMIAIYATFFNNSILINNQLFTFTFLGYIRNNVLSPLANLLFS